jgi:hypothetical protein
MKPLYNTEEYNICKSNDLLPCECYVCGNSFYRKKKNIKCTLNGTKPDIKFCSRLCQDKANFKKQNVKCKNCGIEFLKIPAEIKKSKNHFCSKSCNATYQNTHKIYGTRRSKLEIYLEEQLTLMYPDLHIDYNKTEAINSELDIYIPSLKLAFELNGIFHYEPIYGQKKLNQTQNNDQRKFQACIEKNISLCILDVSSMNYFKKERADKFLNIITEIITNKSKN